MADLFSLEATADIGAGAAGPRLGTSLDTGVLRRKYDFGDRVSELSIAQDPFFRMVSKVGKKPTDDPEFKFTERRPSFHKRYAYIVAHHAASSGQHSAVDTEATASAGLLNATDELWLLMGTDYDYRGNVGNRFGQTSNDEVKVGDNYTMPKFFLEDQVVKLNLGADGVPGTQTEYCLVKVVEVGNTVGTDEYQNIKVRVVREPASVGSNLDFCSYSSASASLDNVSIASDSISSVLEAKRCYVVGSAHSQGSGYPETWKDQPFSTGFGRTQIWKTAMAMDNTTRATVLKYEPNEFARVWKEKLVEHKWDIEQSILFGSQYDSGDEWYTQGAVDFISSYGNVFSLTHASKTQDDFLDDLSNFLDPRHNNANASLFFVDTATYNWLHKLSGYFSNNLEISPNFRADMSLTSKKKAFGVDITVISTPYGDMNVARNIHLDSHPIKILAVNMKYCSYRPLVGNGLNRDTAIYVGVQTLENSGVDRRVDLIQTEAGMEWQMPEAHAYWS